MTALFTVLTILVIIASILLIAVVLLQNGKGEGLASNFVAGNQTLGVRQTADLLEKVTWGLVAFILVISIVTSFTTKGEADVAPQIETTTQQPEFPASPIQQDVPSAELPAAETPATPAQ